MLIDLNVCSYYMLIELTICLLCMLLELIKITRSEPTKTESLAGIEIESKGVSISK